RDVVADRPARRVLADGGQETLERRGHRELARLFEQRREPRTSQLPVLGIEHLVGPVAEDEQPVAATERELPAFLTTTRDERAQHDAAAFDLVGGARTGLEQEHRWMAGVEVADATIGAELRVDERGVRRALEHVHTSGELPEHGLG